MRDRVLILVVVLAAVLLQPARLDAFRYGFDPDQPLYGGYIAEDATCPGATHVLIAPCLHTKQQYLAFHMKGIKKYLQGTVVLQGPIDTTTCSLPLIDVRRIHEGPTAPPCAP
jgi:hypothetical protein